METSSQNVFWVGHLLAAADHEVWGIQIRIATGIVFAIFLDEDRGFGVHGLLEPAAAAAPY